MKHLLTGMALFGALVTSVPCTAFAQSEDVENNQQITREIKADAFDQIKVEGSCGIVFTPTAGKPKVKLTMAKSDDPYITVEVKDRTLMISHKRKTTYYNEEHHAHFGTTPPVHLDISAPMFERAVVNGSADFEFTTDVTTPKEVKFVINGLGNIKMPHLQAAGLQTVVNGACNLSMQTLEANWVKTVTNGVDNIKIGTTKVQTATICVNGTSNQIWKNMQADQLEMAIAGMGNFDLQKVTADEVAVSLEGSGDIQLAGTCNRAEYVMKGNSDIRATDLKAKQVKAKATSGEGTIKCYASETIELSGIEPERVISYVGNPKVLKP